MTGLWLLSTPQEQVLCLPQERLQNLWAVYQRLGLEDDIVDPSNELIKEGPIQKISTRNNSTSEKYLFLVGAGVPGAGEGADEVGVRRGVVQPGQGVTGSF